VSGLTASLAQELGAYNINVNAIAPGMITTEATMLSTTEEERQRSNESRAIRRLGEPEDLTGTLVFLASDDSDWIAGQTIILDGGKIMRL
jgi:3-oxoacyl-[acyl-carrier protein] reductase